MKSIDLAHKTSLILGGPVFTALHKVVDEVQDAFEKEGIYCAIIQYYWTVIRCHGDMTIVKAYGAALFFVSGYA